MESTVVSGPLGRPQWEPEQPFPLGFPRVDPDGGGVLGPNTAGPAGLDFRKAGQDHEGPALEDLLQASGLSPEGLQFEGQSNGYLQGLTFTEKLDEIGDGTLSWLFSPTLTDVMGKSSALKADSRRNSEPFLLVDFSDELSGLDARIAAEERAHPPPFPSRETLSLETRDEGLFPDQVTELHKANRSAAEVGLSESCPPPDHTSEPAEPAVHLLDLEVPDFAGPPVIKHVLAEERVEDDSLAPSFLTLPVEEDACSYHDLTGEGDACLDLMEDQNSLAAETGWKQEEMALEEVHDQEDDPWNAAEGADERPLDQNPHPHRHQVASCGLSIQDASPPAASAGTQRPDDVSLSLKAVFDALDQDGDGFVRIEEFMEFAAAYGADQVKDLTKFLDPSGLGVISYEDFHRGISAISNGGPEPHLYSYSPGDGAGGCPEEYDEQNEVTDSAYLGSESTYSECETFTDEDTGALVPPEMHEDVETDSGIEATLHDPEDGGSRFSLNSELHSHSLVTVISGEEEHFEDFGESNTSELLLETTVDGSMGEGDSALTQPAEQLNGSSLISTSAGKRLSSKKVARHLLQNSSMTLDTMSDLTRDILELADNDITDKVLLLERRVAELEKESEASGEQHARLRQDNLQLVHRANALEEQLKEQELQADEQLQQESRRHKEALSKLEREKELELENAQARLQQLDDENSELRSCVPCLRANIERLEEEKRKLQDEVETASDQLSEETESRRKMADKLSHERHQNQKEKESTQELIEDLRKQLEHLQLYRLEAEAKRGRTPGAGLQEYQTRTREAELEQEIKRLKQDNRTLKEQNDELNGQIINLSIQGAKSLMSASFSDSLAAEINSVSRSELMEAVHKQEEINYRLQDYIDKIIVAIMESNPSILEVK